MADTRTMQASVGAVFIQQQHIPIGQAAGILLAFLIEACLFLAIGSAGFRSRLAAEPPVRVAAGLTAINALTWLLAGGGAWWQLAATTAASAAIAFWYLRLPKTDAPLLVLYGALALTKASTLLYFMPWPKAPTPIIGELAWLRTLLLAVLLFRRPVLANFGFIPTKEEWKQGIKWFLYFLPAAAAVGLPIGFVKLRTLPSEPERIALAIVGTFLGHYIFVALREELLFRGMLLPRLQAALGATPGLLTGALLFGAVHLPFSGFPNWRFAAVAAVAGWFYSKSYLATGSIRSAMVTHALTNVVARVFLST